jgi:hypothetical protein
VVKRILRAREALRVTGIVVSEILLPKKSRHLALRRVLSIARLRPFVSKNLKKTIFDIAFSKKIGKHPFFGKPSMKSLLSSPESQKKDQNPMQATFFVNSTHFREISSDADLT